MSNHVTFNLTPTSSSPKAPPRKRVVKSANARLTNLKRPTSSTEKYPKSGGNVSSHSVGYYVNTRELRLILIGHIGVGKSSTVNTIVGRYHFLAKKSAHAVTRSCNYIKTKAVGRTLLLVDVPGVDGSNGLEKKEIIKCIGMTSPGPHAILFVIRPDRFTREEFETFNNLRVIFGREVAKYIIVLFSRKDDLSSENTTIDSYVRLASPDLKLLLQECGNRYIAIDNMACPGEKQRQTAMLINMVDEMVYKNGGKYFYNIMYLEVEGELKEREKNNEEVLCREKMQR